MVVGKTWCVYVCECACLRVLGWILFNADNGMCENTANGSETATKPLRGKEGERHLLSYFTIKLIMYGRCNSRFQVKMSSKVTGGITELAASEHGASKRKGTGSLSL